MDTSAETLQETCPICKKKLLVKAIQVTFASSWKKELIKSMKPVTKEDVMMLWRRVLEFTGIAVNGIPMNGIYKHH